MLNTRFLKRLAAVIYWVGWAYIVVVPPASIMVVLGGREISKSLREQGSRLFTGTIHTGFPWDRLVLVVVASVAVGAGLMVLARLIHLGIAALEHLRSLDQSERAAVATETEAGGETSEGRCGRMVRLPGVFPPLRLLSKVVGVLGRAILALAVLSVLLKISLPGMVVLRYSWPYRMSVGALGLIKALAWGLGMLGLSQGLLWADEAVAHLRRLGAPRDEGGQPTEGRPT
jgi:hypothetical protein